jgi:hypothetical protein
MSSSASKASSYELKYFEEGVDYDKNPRKIIILRAIHAILFLLIIIFAIVQYILSSKY